VRPAVLALTASLAVGCSSRALAPTDGGEEGGAADAGDAAADNAPNVPRPTCGGDLVGTWAVAQKNLPPAVPGPSVDVCLNLQLGRDGDTFTASTWIPNSGPERDVAIHFMPSGAFDVEDLRRGPTVVHYGASCLASSVGTPTCDQLAAAIGVWGLDTGEFQHATCAAASSGGCDCTLELSVVVGASGSWSNGEGAVTFFNGISAVQTTTAYCVDTTGLRFDRDVEAVLPGGSGFTFQPVDCADNKQGPLEDGVDCGWACPMLCVGP
jgi:hypothetical protein